MEEVHLLITSGNWSNIFDNRESGFWEVSMEFMCTFTMEEVPSTLRATTCSFPILAPLTPPRLRNSPHTLDSTWRNKFCSIALTIFPTISHNGCQPWLHGVPSWGAQLYEARSAWSTRIHSPAQKYLQHLINHTIAARSLSKNVVGCFDLLYLYSMEERYLLHLSLRRSGVHITSPASLKRWNIGIARL